MSQCTEDECESQARSRGLCNKHYLRYLKAGGERGYLTEEEYFWNHVDKDGPLPEQHPELGPCWIWTGRTGENGYGVFNLSRRTRDSDGPHAEMAHRYAYKITKGPIGDDPKTGEPLTLDHFACDRHECVNPDHTRPATLLENIRRSSPTANKTHCPQNHEYTPENTKITSRGWRQCRECSRVWQRQRAKRLRR